MAGISSPLKKTIQSINDLIEEHMDHEEVIVLEDISNNGLSLVKEYESQEVWTENNPFSSPTKEVIKNKENGDVMKTPTDRKRLTLPATPKGPMRRRSSLDLSQRDCCPSIAEKMRNLRMPIEFDSQVKHFDFMHMRPRPISIFNTIMLSEFKVGMSMNIQLAMMKEKTHKVGDRVLLVISQGNNEIRFDAREFLRKTIFCIEDLFIRNKSEEEDKYDDWFPTGKTVEVSSVKDTISTWCLLRTFVENVNTNKLYISCPTFAEIKKLTPMLNQITDYYISYILERNGEVKDDEEDVPDTPTYSPKSPM